VWWPFVPSAQIDYNRVGLLAYTDKSIS